MWYSLLPSNTAKAGVLRYDILILDDIINSKTSANKAIRDGTEMTLYNDILPAMSHTSNYKFIHFIGTHFHPDDLYVRLEGKGTYRVLKTPAMKKDKNGELASIWEHMVTTKELLEIQGENPLAFEQQYMQKVRRGSGGIFRPEWIQYFDKYKVVNDKVFVTVVKNEEGETEEREVKIFSACDLAISQKNTADFFVQTIIGIDEYKNVFVLDYDRGRYTFKEQIDTIKRMGEKWSQAIRIGVESVAYQQAMLQELQRTTYLPVVRINQSKDKVSRLNAFGSLFEAGKVFFYSHLPQITDYTDEFLGFPNSAPFDDIPDSCCMAWETAKKNVQQTSGLTRDMFNF